MSAHAIWNRILETFAPAECAACDEPLGLSQVCFCASCAPQSPSAPESLANIPQVPIFVGAHYADAVARAIQRFKFEQRFELAQPLAAWLGKNLQALPSRAADLWIPVPLHRQRLAERGYNQAALLAKLLARQQHGVFLATGLKRNKRTQQQARLNPSERRSNIAQAFSVQISGANCTLAAPKPGMPRVILVDDVVTTGSTVGACAAALRAASFEVIAVVALAIAGASN